MLSSGRRQFRAEESSALLVAIHAEHAGILGHDLGPALSVKPDLTHRDVLLLYLSEGPTNHGDVGLAEDDTQPRAALETMGLVLHAVKPGDAPVIRGFM